MAIEKSYHQTQMLNKLFLIFFLISFNVFTCAELNNLSIYSQDTRTISLNYIQSYEGIKSTGQIKIDKDLDIDITGKNILIVEDIFDTGLTISHLKNLLASRNPKSIEILCMFIKKDVATEPVDIKYSGFEIGPEFVVGYGLDYEGKYRELPFLGVLS